MRYRLHDAPALLRTPVGRRQLRAGIDYRLWPLTGALARVHRATLARRPTVVAVVGSLGKTTTARAVRAALTGNVDLSLRDNYFGHVARGVLAIRPRDAYAVLEVGIDRSGQMARYARVVRPDVVVATSIASEHNRSLATLDTARDEKQRMVAALPPDGLAVLNGDDERVRSMARVTVARVVTFGFDAGNEVRASDVALDWPHGTRFTLHAGDRQRQVGLRLVGPPGVQAALAALAVAYGRGLDLDLAAERLGELPPTPMRLEPVRLPSGAYLLRDEFKSTLETIESALELLAAIPARRRIVVLGDVSEPPGKQGPIYRALGVRLAGCADRVLLIGKAVDRYAAGLRQAGFPRNAIVDCRGLVSVAVEALRDDLRDGDVVLIKGRDTQRLDRIALSLLGRDVRCALKRCAILSGCEGCGMLERGWDGLRVVM